jgi:hypothetical protein
MEKDDFAEAPGDQAKKRFTISEAAGAAGVSRSAFYKNYIQPNPSRISVLKDEKNRPYIELCELLRVFPKLSKVSSKRHGKVSENTWVDTAGDTENTTDMLVELGVMRERLRAAEEARRVAEERLDEAAERERKLWGELEAVRLLAAPAKPPEGGPGWWARTFGRRGK